ncbi:RING-H2 finger protein ATL79-like [Panicum miliaceum]|uniref:RING-H2 finger protein ATL79-like n=1 Tax=Panicum miliaceum TaxID=4540 RepID=A0A3L6RVN2_PANMI|nr:RING-H2 finger protein ATL79-like [Panicum miliaceum]
MAMAPQGQEHEQPHGQRPAPTSHNASAGSTIATNRWGPYSGAGDFASNMAVILAALLAALALALALNAAVRYVLRRGRRGAHRAAAAATEADPDPEKAPPPPPALVYSAAGTKLAGAAAECAICLAEFVDGDAVRVMPACGHGFHARCIERWLAGGRRSSCPTCRAPLAAAETGAAAQAEAAASASS